MKWQTTIVPFLLFTSATISVAQSPSQGQASDQGAQIRGYWVDPASGLTWRAKDNGKDVSYRGAVKYCRNLRSAGYSDWRLANMFELQGVYDATANAPGLAGTHNDVHTMWHVKGTLFLTGYQWANNQTKETSGYQYFLDFNDGKSNSQPSGFLYSSSFMRALCTRGSGDPLAAQREAARSDH